MVRCMNLFFDNIHITRDVDHKDKDISIIQVVYN